MGSRLVTTAAAAGCGAAAAYFLDPDQGARRRNMTRDRAVALLRRGSRRAEGAARGASAEVHGAAQRAAAATREQEPPANDQTLASKVETEIFRDPDVPKGKINVDAADGVVSLRGEVDRPEQVEELEAATRRVAGVRDVENLLHLPGETPANVASVSDAGA